MMYDDVGLETIDSAPSDEAVPAMKSFADSLRPRPSEPSIVTPLDERLIRVIKALDR